ncbi:MAG TPA: zf-HC2 domain-containing protein [Pyrinomonadaceae bacterium]|jgi:hypothetical protein
MNCKRAAGLLPLYAAGDLEGARARGVASHVAACAGCRRAVDEFTESRALLAEAFETPEFGAEFYAGIRSSVLERISRDREPSAPSFVAALFGRRAAYATTFAVALIALALAFQHSRGGRETPRELARTTPPTVAATKQGDQLKAAGPPREAKVSAASEPTRKPTYAAAGRRAESARRDAPAGRREQARKTLAREGESALVAQAVPPPVNGARTTMESAPRAGVSSAAAAGAAPEVSRIEIQTADPNIRIIWLAPQKSEEPDPNEPKNENGERK